MCEVQSQNRDLTSKVIQKLEAAKDAQGMDPLSHSFHLLFPIQNTHDIRWEYLHELVGQDPPANEYYYSVRERETAARLAELSQDTELTRALVNTLFDDPSYAELAQYLCVKVRTISPLDPQQDPSEIRYSQAWVAFFFPAGSISAPKEEMI